MDAFEKAQSEQATLEQMIADINSQALAMEKRLQEVRAFIKLYNEYQSPKLAVHQEVMLYGSRPKSKKDQIIDLAKKLLADGRHRHTTEILDAVEKSGIEITASDKALSISSILSKEAIFQSSRKHGWSLVKQDEIILRSLPSDYFTKNPQVTTV
jgi:hypothetical protein